MAWVVLLAAIVIPIVIIAFAPTGTYRVTVVVQYSDGGVIPDARVTSSVGGQEKRTDNAVEFEIPATALPSDHKVTFFANKSGAVGQTTTELSSNRSASVTVTLDAKRPPDNPSLPGSFTVALHGELRPTSPGQPAMITVQTTPRAVCTIEVHYHSGLSEAHGLEPKVADESGMVTWTWRVGLKTKPGSWPIVVECISEGRRAHLAETELKIIP